MAGWDSSRLRSGHYARVKKHRFCFLNYFVSIFQLKYWKSVLPVYLQDKGQYKFLLKALWTKFKNANRAILEPCSVTGARNQDTDSLLASTQVHMSRDLVSFAQFLHYPPASFIVGDCQMSPWIKHLDSRLSTAQFMCCSFVIHVRQFYQWIRLIWKASTYTVFEHSLYINGQSEGSGRTGTVDLTPEDGC